VHRPGSTGPATGSTLHPLLFLPSSSVGLSSERGRRPSAAWGPRGRRRAAPSLLSSSFPPSSERGGSGRPPSSTPPYLLRAAALHTHPVWCCRRPMHYCPCSGSRSMSSGVPIRGGREQINTFLHPHLAPAGSIEFMLV
jgi:hypothetical protein